VLTLARAPQEAEVLHKRSYGRLEAKLARNYAFQHSRRARGTVKETVYTDTAEQLRQQVLAIVKGDREEAIPEIPQGLVIHDSIGTGAFD